jgi:hypothetical protein
MFDLLQFQRDSIPGAVRALYKFRNGWGISVLSGLAGSGLYGRIDEHTYEVAIIRPNEQSNHDVSGWNTKEEVSAMMWVLSQL